ncbi:MAG: transporter ATP-binding protein, partial [Planctomycetaceae bacterium]|nr:transporter ATP-binding protein [Planctomycetaceae bacterium]
QSVSQTEGRTVLFVSHNLPAIQSLCTRALLLRNGMVAHSGDVESAVHLYLNEGGGPAVATPWRYRARSAEMKITRVELMSNGVATEAILAGQHCTFVIHYECCNPGRFGKGIGVSIVLKSDEHKIVNLWSVYQPTLMVVPDTTGTIECHLQTWPFREASFTVDVYTHVGDSTIEWIEGCLAFASHDGDFYGVGRLSNPGEGILFIPQRWDSR